MKDASIPSQIRILIVAAGLAIAAQACGGSGGGGEAGSGGGGTSGAGGSTGACNVDNIFQTHMCTSAGCHTSGSPAANFDMVTAGWQNNLVGVAPTQVPSSSMAIPSSCVDMGKVFLDKGSNPATGLFLEKLKHNPSCGLQMPFLLTNLYLSTADLACVQTWANGLVAAAH